MGEGAVLWKRCCIIGEGAVLWEKMLHYVKSALLC